MANFLQLIHSLILLQGKDRFRHKWQRLFYLDLIYRVFLGLLHKGISVYRVYKVSKVKVQIFHRKKQNVNKKKSPKLIKSPAKTYNLHQVKWKVLFFWSLKIWWKGQIASNIKIRPGWYTQTDVCNRIINGRNHAQIFYLIFWVFGLFYLHSR